MRHRATQLILPFEPALPGRQILAPRLWPTMTPTTQQQLAKRVAQLLRSRLTAADVGDLIGGHHDEHAAQFGKPGDDGASRQAGLYLRAPIDRRPSPSASGEHRAAVSAGRSCSLVRLAQGNGLRSLMTTSGSPVRRATA